MTLEGRVYRRLLTGWKSTGQLARELGVPRGEVEEAIEELRAEGKLFRDGPLYIAKAGVDWGDDWGGAYYGEEGLFHKQGLVSTGRNRPRQRNRGRRA